MRRLWIVSVGCSLFFCQPAESQDTVEITLKPCREIATQNDPSIATRSVVEARQECGEAYAKKVEIIDRHFGIRTSAKSLHGVTVKARTMQPQETDVFTTHQPCRFTYRYEQGEYEGIVMEWLVPKSSVCAGRPAGSYYRVYTWDNQICLRPYGGCVKVDDLTPLGQQRYRDVVSISYEYTQAMQ